MRGAQPDRHLESHVAEALALQRDETLLVAASAGPDSTALAALAVRAATVAGARVFLGHVNHAVRGSAWQDEGVALAIGAALGVRVVCRSIDPGSGGEARLRTARYRALAGLAASVGARRVATAHHARDQAETVLLALFRGSGARGLAGMEPVRPLAGGIELVRPLLRVAPETLVDYCRRRDLPHALDATNADLRIRRNALRAALATLRETFPALDEAVARCAQILRDEAEQTARSELRASLRRSLAGQIGLADVSFERIEAAARLVESGRPGRVFIKPGVELTTGR